LSAQTDNQQGKISETDIAWLAGLWDGEGSIGMKVQKYHVGGRTYFEPYAQVVNTHAGTLEHVDAILTELRVGHHISWPRPHQHPNGTMPVSDYKPLWSVRIHGLNRVKALLKWISPFLVTKAEQAKLVNEYIQSREGHQYRQYWAYSERELEIVNTFRMGRHSGKTTKVLSRESLNDYTRGALSESAKV